MSPHNKQEPQGRKFFFQDQALPILSTASVQQEQRSDNAKPFQPTFRQRCYFCDCRLFIPEQMSREINEYRTYNSWNETDHPRDDHGKFTTKGSGSKGTGKTEQDEKKQEKHSSRDAGTEATDKKFAREQIAAGRLYALKRETDKALDAYLVNYLEKRGVDLLKIIPPVGRKEARIDYPQGSGMAQPLSRDPAVYATLVRKYPHARDMEYHPDAIALVQTARYHILAAAGEFSLPPEAIAGAMLDENTRINERLLVDSLQDWAIQEGKPSNISYAEMERYVASTPASQRKRAISDPRMWDVGPYNINMATGFEVFQRYVLPSEAHNGLKKVALRGLPPGTTKQEKWLAFIHNCLLNPQGGAYVAAVLMRDGAKNLELYTHGASKEEKAALLVTYYKQGFDTMKRLYTERVKKTKDGSHMKPGEGAVIFYQMPIIHTLLYDHGKEKQQ